MTVELWQSWHGAGRKREHLKPLLDAHAPIIEKEVTRWGASGLPPVVLRAQARKLAIEAFKSYDPAKAKLTTHVMNHMQRMDRFVNTHAPDIRVAQEKVHLGNKVIRAKHELELNLGREATVDEIAKHAGVGKETIGTLRRHQARLYSSNEGEDSFNQPVRDDIDHAGLVMGFLHHDLSPQQQIVFRHLTGHDGHEVLPPAEIAKKAGISVQRVSNIKAQILKKARRYQQAVGSLMEE